MAKQSIRTQAFLEGSARTLKLSLKASSIALALYIVFPPFWDTLFAADLQTLHKAPYRAADRAYRLWHNVAGKFEGTKGHRSGEPAGQLPTPGPGA